MKCTIYWQFSISSIITVELMSRLSCIALIIAMNVLMCVFAEEVKLYSDRYDHIDIRAALNNKEVREAYYNCFMELAPCQTPEQVALTAMFGEAYQTKCRRCTEKQKEILNLTAEWFVENDPEKWRLIVAKTIELMKRKAAQSTAGNTNE
ncbi:PREDICTED: ejaculatory bulb-specific protein 3-like [Wasmannia auropunctata]|uniref:ejaculatory bulb-specific protein 3-like n=1 Tax=Wasmannia auropunctata TaxID=64793 RepID=UPI0005EF9779|nr:PREDICTED: ejaculatory bulb-specific protein 3-like [Wasmannia auropunctata]